MKKLLTIVMITISSLGFARDYQLKDDRTNNAIASGEVLSTTCENYTGLFQTGSTTALKNIEDRGFVIENPYGLIMLGIPQNEQNATAGDAIVELTVTYEYAVNDIIQTKTENVTLTLSASESEFKDIDYVKVVGALKMDVTINNVTGIANFSDIELVSSCKGTYYGLLNPASVVSDLHYTAPTLRADGGLVDGNLLVSWSENIIQGAGAIQPEAYELEWTYDSPQINDTEDIYLRDYLFKNNSSRIVTTNTQYFIPLVYEKGIIIFRVRAIGKNIVEGELTDVRSQWTLIENQTSSDGIDPNYLFTFQGLEVNLNWQSTITFAEEGKNKAVVTYHDGSLRNRQAVTRINTDQRAIVGETYYDYNGRPVIQMLPVPVSGTEENNFDFRPGFNIITNSSLLKSEYEQGISNQSCSPLAPEFQNTTGSSQYYSTNNGFGDQGNTGNHILNREMIPDAENYPYTQTNYRNDNTGRIASQSGVGKAHILSSGHETKYMYGAPTQSEISRLFGNQVGLSAHYKKNQVIDPNGQVSVSYMNPEGKVIATALAGHDPDALEQLPGEKTRVISSDILSEGTNTLDSDKKGKTFLHKFTVSSPTDYHFNYKVEANTHEVTCTGINSPDPITLKMAPVLDIKLSLYDNCNNTYFTHVLESNAAFGPDAVKLLDSISATASQLPIGEYTLVKTLRINQSKLEAYLEEYISNDTYTCVLREEDFLADALMNIDDAACDLTCSSCMERINTLIAEVEAESGTSISAVDKSELYSRCEVLCLDNVTCTSALFSMMAHMAPDAQYGQVREQNPDLKKLTQPVDGNNIDESIDITDKYIDFNGQDGDPTLGAVDNSIVPEKFPLSIFNDDNQLLPNLGIRNTSDDFLRASWRRPLQVIVPGFTAPNYLNQAMVDGVLEGVKYQETNYYSTSGEIIYAYVTEVSTGVYAPAVVDNSPVEIANSDLEPNVYKVPIKYLADVKDFLPYWEGHFSNYLVPYHPEFGYYIECTTRGDINGYAEGLIDINRPEQDSEFKYVKEEIVDGVTKYVPDVLANDPIFTDPAIETKYKDALISKVNELQKKPSGNAYYSMAEVSTMMVNCPDPNATCQNPDCESGIFEADDLEEWTTFKALYLGERDKILKEISTYNAMKGYYYNGCIGTKDYLSSNERSWLLDNSNVVETEESYTTIQSWANKICFGWCSKFIKPKIKYIKVINPNQTCVDVRAPLFEESMRAFYPSLPGIEPSDFSVSEDDENICYEVSRSETNEGQFIAGNCQLNMIDQAAIAGNAEGVRSYQACGHCPLVIQVQDLMTELIDNDLLNNSIDDFNCVVNSPNFSLGLELSTFVSSGNNTLYDWNGSFNATTKQLIGTVSQTGSLNSLQFNMDFTASGITDETKAVDLFPYLQVASIDTDPNNANQLYLNVYVELNKAFPNQYQDLENILSEVTLSEEYVTRHQFSVPITVQQITSGAPVNLDFSTCSFEPVCSTSDYSNKVLSFLNNLVYYNDEMVDIDGQQELVKTYDLTATTDITLEEGTIYEMPVRQLLGIDELTSTGFTTDLNNMNALWRVETSFSDEVTGNLIYTENNEEKKVEISIMPEVVTGINTSVDVTKIIKFKNIRPFDIACSNGVCTSSKFYAVAVNQENRDGLTNASVYYPVVIQVRLISSQGIELPITTRCEKITTANE